MMGTKTDRVSQKRQTKKSQATHFELEVEDRGHLQQTWEAQRLDRNNTNVSEGQEMWALGLSRHVRTNSDFAT